MEINNSSGHYKPGTQSLQSVVQEFDRNLAVRPQLKWLNWQSMIVFGSVSPSGCVVTL